jgi:hypothetical protein
MLEKSLGGALIRLWPQVPTVYVKSRHPMLVRKPRFGLCFSAWPEGFRGRVAGRRRIFWKNPP